MNDDEVTVLEVSKVISLCNKSLNFIGWEVVNKIITIPILLLD
jgi:hypothetical protein